MRIDLVKDLQEEVEQVSTTIGPIHVVVKQALLAVDMHSLEQISFEFVEEVIKLKEYVPRRLEEVKKFQQDFKQKLNTLTLSF